MVAPSIDHFKRDESTRKKEKNKSILNERNEILQRNSKRKPGPNSESGIAILMKKDKKKQNPKMSSILTNGTPTTCSVFPTDSRIVGENQGLN